MSHIDNLSHLAALYPADAQTAFNRDRHLPSTRTPTSVTSGRIRPPEATPRSTTLHRPRVSTAGTLSCLATLAHSGAPMPPAPGQCLPSVATNPPVADGSVLGLAVAPRRIKYRKAPGIPSEVPRTLQREKEAWPTTGILARISALHDQGWDDPSILVVHPYLKGLRLMPLGQEEHSPETSRLATGPGPVPLLLQFGRHCAHGHP